MTPHARAGWLYTLLHPNIKIFEDQFKLAQNDAFELAALIAWNSGQTGTAGLIREKKHEVTE